MLFKNQFNNFLFSYLPIDYITNMMSSLLWQYSNIRVY